jgi:rare lipoprotein A (peptidoglycan hydrolase)
VKISLSNKKGSRFRPLAIAAGFFALLMLSACAPYEARHGALHYRERGEASWYGPGFAGKKTASGERFNPSALTAAHRTLPFGTTLMVTNLDNEKTVIVRVNDRGPFAAGRIIDLSKAAGAKIGLNATGTARVEVVAVSPRGHKRDGAPETEDLDAATADIAASTPVAKDSPTLLASRKLSRGHKGERPVTRNGVEYLITQDKAHGGDDVVLDEAPATAKENARKSKKAAKAERKVLPAPEEVSSDIGDDEEVDDLAASAHGGADTAAAPKSLARKPIRTAPKAIERTPAKAAPKAEPKAASKATPKSAPKSAAAPDDEEF